MELSPRKILIILSSCFFFSFGIFSAHVYSRLQVSHNLHNEIQQLNTLQSEKIELLRLLQKDFKAPNLKIVSSHVEAFIQKSTMYQYENLLVNHLEQSSLQEFYGNFLMGIGHHFPDSSSLVQALMILENKLVTQRTKTLNYLSKTL